MFAWSRQRYTIIDEYHPEKRFDEQLSALIRPSRASFGFNNASSGATACAATAAERFAICTFSPKSNRNSDLFGIAHD
jgi:hypothetical protein